MTKPSHPQPVAGSSSVYWYLSRLFPTCVVLTLVVVLIFNFSHLLHSSSTLKLGGNTKSMAMNSKAKIVLVTGGAGYIGSHTVVELLNAGYDVVVIDNLCNSNPLSLKRVEQITGKKILQFYQIDLIDAARVEEVFSAHKFFAVIHFAGLKAVGESVSQPLRYYHNNIGSTLVLVEAMSKHGVFNLVFSSSATVYGTPESLPITESAPLRATNPYGRTKLFIEDILRDVVAAEPRFHIMLLRYFNPVGAHPSGLIGEDPRGIPNNLMPYVTQVAVGKLPFLRVFGNDYPGTPDGTGVRDYIHVVDLAKGHIAAMEHLEATGAGCTAINLGTGRGYSVLQLVAAMERASGRKIPYEIHPRRPGDVAALWADTSKAEAELGWKAQLTLDDMCKDAWNWQSKNPRGYEG